jgi:hypothetical protein
MARVRIPIAFLISGLVAKGAVLVLWKFDGLRPILLRLMNLDGTVWLAFKICNALFDPRREMPAAQEYLVFNSVLILGFGLECLCVGFAVEIIRNRLKPTKPESAPNAAPVL